MTENTLSTRRNEVRIHAKGVRGDARRHGENRYNADERLRCYEPTSSSLILGGAELVGAVELPPLENMLDRLGRPVDVADSGGEPSGGRSKRLPVCVPFGDVGGGEEGLWAAGLDPCPADASLSRNSIHRFENDWR